MDRMKSYPAFYAGVICELYRDVAECYSVTRKVQKVELDLIQSRLREEGLPFLTVTLPRFGKALDSALSSGTRFSIVGFEKANDSSIPKFLGWLVNRVLDLHGFELVEPNPIALKHFRQLVYLFYKLEIPHDSETAKTVIESFVETDRELEQYEEGPVAICDGALNLRIASAPGWSHEWINTARALVARVVSPIDPLAVNPRHGPGAVATGEDVCEKSNFSRIYQSVEHVYPFTEWFMFNLNHVLQSIPSQNPRLSVVTSPTAKVVLVPKDSRGPRLISCEPLEIQWLQQGLGVALQNQIEVHRLTRGHVNFRDQGVNRRLALAGSSGDKWVTLDMKDASDRVSKRLIEILFADHPRLLEALLAARSCSTRLPDGRIVPLRKFAPMGSALCFPVESLVFWALSASAIKTVRSSTYREACGHVYVFGDDLIVRESDYTTLLQFLPTVGLKFNYSKCCTARFFRESCGCDAYVGVDVTPVKLKTVWSRHRTNPKQLSSYVAFSNAMYGLSYFRTADYVRNAIRTSYIGSKIPYTNQYIVSDNGAYTSTFGGLGFVCHEPARAMNDRHGFRTQYNSWLQRREVLTFQVIPIKRKTRIDGYPELLRRMSGGYGSHGGVYALVRRNRLNRTWVEAL